MFRSMSWWASMSNLDHASTNPSGIESDATSIIYVLRSSAFLPALLWNELSRRGMPRLYFPHVDGVDLGTYTDGPHDVPDQPFLDL